MVDPTGGRPRGWHAPTAWEQSGTHLVPIWYRSGTNQVPIWYTFRTNERMLMFKRMPSDRLPREHSWEHRCGEMQVDAGILDLLQIWYQVIS